MSTCDDAPSQRLSDEIASAISDLRDRYRRLLLAQDDTERMLLLSELKQALVRHGGGLEVRRTEAGAGVVDPAMRLMLVESMRGLEPVPAAKGAQSEGKAMAYDHFEDVSWEDRLRKLTGQSADEFGSANADLITRWLEGAGTETGVRVVLNMGGAAFQAFLETEDYKNVYERPVVAGEERTPSATRRKVDYALGLLPREDAEDCPYYFCALSSGGTGVRFYGEYCIVLKNDAANSAIDRTFDRNSYDLTRPPLSQMDQATAVRVLTAQWGPPTYNMLAVKVLRSLWNNGRLTTAGLIAAGVLTDEDYAEAYYSTKIRFDAVAEIREAPGDAVVEDEIRSRARHGEVPTPAEMIWAARRSRVRELMMDKGLPRRIIVTAGRTARWS